eukprot:gb/GFBE01012549.1/.p1 GENE.gb/GFBE01012549.1/~~gb/GFBE01012549.1/.p1  ORF type:complete len:348 (+),score=65.16 gb/GFBE01012549.1/:1-1044(+)
MQAVRAVSRRFSTCAASAAAVGLLTVAPRCPARCEDAEKAQGASVGLNPFHNLLPGLQESYKSKNPGQIVSKHKEKNKVVRIVLTGGPCAGKSSCLDHISKEATRAGFDVIQVPEVATVIFNSGYKLPPKDEPRFAETIVQFQITVARLQLQLERNLIYLAELTETPTIIVFDRGLLDGKAYMTNEDGTINEDRWLSVLGGLTTSKSQPVDEQYCLDRYDAVVHLMTTAEDGVVDSTGNPIYKWGWLTDDSGHKVYRRESKDEAFALDRLARKVWEKHPNHVIVKNTEGGMNDKIRAAVDAVMVKAEEIHPQQVTQQTLRRRMRELSLENAQLQRRLAILESQSLRT